MNEHQWRDKETNLLPFPFLHYFLSSTLFVRFGETKKEAEERLKMYSVWQWGWNPSDPWSVRFHCSPGPSAPGLRVQKRRQRKTNATDMLIYPFSLLLLLHDEGCACVTGRHVMSFMIFVCFIYLMSFFLFVWLETRLDAAPPDLIKTWDIIRYQTLGSPFFLSFFPFGFDSTSFYLSWQRGVDANESPAQSNSALPRLGI